MNIDQQKEAPPALGVASVRPPVCMHCGEPITEPAINFDAPSDIWQCADCHYIEWGSWPFGECLSMPNDQDVGRAGSAPTQALNPSK